MSIFNPSPQVPFDAENVIQLYEEFDSVDVVADPNGLGTMNWVQVVNLGGTLVVTALAFANRCGFWTLGVSGTDVNSRSGIYALNGRFLGNQAFYTEFALRTNNAIAPATFGQYVGIAAVPAAVDPADGIYFRAAGIAAWEAVCRNGGIETAVNTTVAQTANFLRFKIISTGLSVQFWVNDVLRATITTNLPTVADTIYPMVNIVDPTGTSNVSMTIDYFFVRIDQLLR